jgi:diguanylate cyclase (GGDEF)-like protein
MPNARTSADATTPRTRERHRLRLALLGLVALPGLSGILVTVAFLTATSSTGLTTTGPSTGLLVALAVLVVAASFATLGLLAYLLRPIDEVAGSRSRLQLLYQQAREDSRHDALTGLGNQRSFHEELDGQMAAVEQRGERFVLVLMDLDDLKVVNDQEGHAAGDGTITALASAMREVARPDDRLFRLGGDEFAMILPATDVESAVRLTERMLHFARRPFPGSRAITFSAGISAVPQFCRDAAMVYRQADAALYWVKRHGRGAVEVFDPERDQLPDDLADATRKAVQEVLLGRLLAPVFQPIVDLRTGRILGFEGLIRPDPRGPLPDTTRLFAAAAASGRTVELDVACIEQVLGAARAIGPDRLLTLNLSPRTLEIRDFDAGWLLQGLYRNGISPARVIIELTERDEIDDLARLRKTFEHLRQYGLRLAADDVGAGNAGLRLLSQVQFDIVKLDLSLVHDGTRRMGARAVLQSLRDLAIDQHAHVVAEGVETARQLQFIRELHIGAGQGYLLGRPGASVEATFVDVDRLGDGAVAPAGAVSWVLEPATQPVEAAERPLPIAAAAALERRPALVLPAARLGSLVGSSAGPA